MENEFDNISTERKQEVPKEDPFEMGSQVESPIIGTVNRKRIEEETPSVKSILSQNAKMVLVCAVIFLWFFALNIMQSTGLITPEMSLLLSLPPFAVIIIVYLIYKRRNGWNSK